MRRHKKEWVHCPECGAHAHSTQKKHYCKKCGYERTVLGSLTGWTGKCICGNKVESDGIMYVKKRCKSCNKFMRYFREKMFNEKWLEREEW